MQVFFVCQFQSHFGFCPAEWDYGINFKVLINKVFLFIFERVGDQGYPGLARNKGEYL